MKKKTFVVGIFVILMVCGLVLAGCDTGTNDTKQDVSNEQLFADVWAYFGCPDVNSWYDDNPAENSAFRFYESDDIADVAAAETYWDSLPNDKT
ncbi:MAG: hypothetical protein LBO65_00385, partial [Spirochaetaceae bacterium]|nr:hypothetical protein [Spirochaetaceae bacterium]